MSIQFPCPHCNDIMTIPDRFAGATRICSNCRGELTAPQPTEENRRAAGAGGTDNPGSAFLGGSSNPADDADTNDNNRTRQSKNTRTSKIAICAAICALISFPVFFMAIPGLLLGLIGRSRIRRSDGRLRGSSLAWTAMALSIVSLVLYSTFAVTLGQQAHQTAKYAYGRFVTTQRMSELHKGMQAALVREVVLPPTLAVVAARGKIPADEARPAIGDADFVYLGAGRTASAMNAEHIMLYWPLMTESEQVLCLFGDGDVRSVKPDELSWMLARQGDRPQRLIHNNLLPEPLLKWLRETEKAKTKPPST